MQVGSLVKDTDGFMGIITYDYRECQPPQPQVWVHWLDGSADWIHIRHLEVICE